MMSKRRSGPPLYELIQSRTQRSSTATDQSAATARGSDATTSTYARSSTASVDVASSSPARWLKPGRALTIPLGYVFVAIALAVGMAFGAYIFGYRSAEQAVRADFEAAWLSRVNDAPLLRDDPLQAMGSSGVVDRMNTAGGHLANQSANRASQSAAASANAATHGWGSVDSDPRQRGSMYFVLMETRKEGALRLANFMRSESLEAYVVPVANSSNWRVITLPALSTSSRQDPTVAELAGKIERAGLKWQLAGGRDNLSGAYIRRY